MVRFTACREYMNTVHLNGLVLQPLRPMISRPGGHITVMSYLSTFTTVNEIPDYEMKQGFFSLSAGARVYFKRFFVNSGVGVSHNHAVRYPLDGGAESKPARRQFYLQKGIGYQIALKGIGQLEPFIFFSTGGMPLDSFSPLDNSVIGIRYYIGL